MSVLQIFSRLPAIALIAVATSLAACGGGSSPTSPSGNGGNKGGTGGNSVGTLSIVRVLPRSQTVDMGGTTRLSASTTDASGRSVGGVTVTWESLSPGVAAVSNDGMVTGQAAGQARIVARAQGLADTAVVSVDATPEGSLTLERHKLTLRRGTSGTLIAVVRDGSGAVVNREVTWTSDAPGVVGVDRNGVIEGLSVGTGRVIAVSGLHADTARISVAQASATGVVARIEVEPSPLSVPRGRNAQLGADAYDTDGGLVSGISVSWRSLNTGVATVSAGGTVTGVAEGMASIIATVGGGAGGSGGVADTVTVTVGPPPVSAVVITPAMLTVQVGGTGTLFATARDDRANTLAGRKISWRSDNPTVVAVASNGMVTGSSAGSARVIASSEGKADTAMVTVTSAAATPASVSVTPSPVTLSAGASQALTATVRDQSGSTIGASVTWSTSNGAVATVSSTGVVTAVSAGTATITARAGGVSGNAKVTVTSATRSNVSKTPTDIGSIGEQDGWAAQLPGVLVAGDNDDTNFGPLQAFVTYSLADIPTGATVESARLALTMEDAGEFGEPFGLGGLYVEWAATLSLNSSAPGSASILVTTGFAATTSTDVTELVKAARAAGATAVTFRVRFAQPRNNDGKTDQLELAAGKLDLTILN